MTPRRLWGRSGASSDHLCRPPVPSSGPRRATFAPAAPLSRASVTNPLPPSALFPGSERSRPFQILSWLLQRPLGHCRLSYRVRQFRVCSVSQFVRSVCDSAASHVEQLRIWRWLVLTAVRDECGARGRIVAVTGMRKAVFFCMENGCRLGAMTWRI